MSIADYDWLWATGRSVLDHPEYEKRSRLPAGQYADWIEGLHRQHPGYERGASQWANFIVMDLLDALREVPEKTLKQTNLYIAFAPHAGRNNHPIKVRDVFNILDALIAEVDNRSAHRALADGIHACIRNPELFVCSIFVSHFGRIALKNLEKFRPRSNA